jgi:probable F420-dependent oxidoreductase
MTDLRTRLGPLGVWGHLPALPAPELRPFTARAAELGYGAMWVGEGAAREPFALLAAVAEASGGMTLGTSIVNIYGRDPMASRMAAMTLHELTGGRFALGLGVSHVHLVQKLRGHAYEKPLTRMREYLDAYDQLPYYGPVVSGPDGEPTVPPVLIAALRPKMLALAASATDGTLPYLVSAARIAWMREVLDAGTPADRPRSVLAPAVATILEADPVKARAIARAWIVPYCRAVNYQRSLAEQGYDASDWERPYSDRLIDDIVAWGDADRVAERIAEYHAAGADHVAVIPLAAEGSGKHLAVLEALAPGT